jgi:hypothetical protein
MYDPDSVGVVSRADLVGHEPPGGVMNASL